MLFAVKSLGLLSLFLITGALSGQVYLEKQSRHRFAQLNFGVDYQFTGGGQSVFLNPDNSRTTLNLEPFHYPRLVIGGTHFWGHADFYIAFSLHNPTQGSREFEAQYFTGVETAFKYYPWRIRHAKIRPYMGIMLAPYTYRQNNDQLSFPEGPELNVNSWPLMTGLTLNLKNQLIEAGISWHYNNQHDYYLSRTQIAQISTPPLAFNFSYRLMLETTLSAEKDWESGRTEKVTRYMSEKGLLNGIFVGAGVSSMFWSQSSSHNELVHPYISGYENSSFLDLALGYYLQKPDMNLTLNYRGMAAGTAAYGVEQQLSRRSLGLEVTKYLFDYHGFVPFIGPVGSLEFLEFQEDIGGQNSIDRQQEKTALGLTFGWDIRPNDLQFFILRTNLRWYPWLDMAVAPGQQVPFGGLEFNFIQLIIYPGRML